MSDNNIRTGDNGTVYLGGEMNFATTPGLYQELKDRFNSHGVIRNIDLGGVGQADSSGLALLLEWQAMTDRLGQQLHIANAPENLLRLAKLCEADQMMDISGRGIKNDDSL